MPLPYLLLRAVGLLSLLLIVSGLWFVVDWAEQGGRSQLWLYFGAVLLALGLFGRGPMLQFFPKSKAPRPVEIVPDEIDVVTGSGGSRLHVEISGPRDGRPLIFTPGWGQDRTVWAGAVRALSDRFRVIVWDPPGLGLSGRPLDGEYSPERLAADLRAVLVLAERPAVLVGHALGGLVVLALCRDRPELLGREIAGVVLLDCADASPLESGEWTPALQTLREPVLEPMLRLDSWLSPLVWLCDWAAYLNGSAHLVALATGFGETATREAVDQAALVGARGAPGVKARGLRSMLDWRAGAATGIGVPLLVVSGGRNLEVRPEAARETAREAPFGEFVLIEEAASFGFLETPEAYEAAIVRHADMVFDRLERSGRALHADVLRSRPPLWDIAPEPRGWSWEAEEPLPGSDEAADEAPRRSEPGRRPAGRA